MEKTVKDAALNILANAERDDIGLEEILQAIKEEAQFIVQNPETKFLTLWCEYDYGQEGFVFLSEEDAKRWLDGEIRDVEGPEGIDGDHADDLFGAGLAGCNPATLIIYND
jgi:hypothetical protein